MAKNMSNKLRIIMLNYGKPFVIISVISLFMIVYHIGVSSKSIDSKNDIHALTWNMAAINNNPFGILFSKHL